MTKDALTPALRASLLAAEQAGITASRRATQSEVLTRITIFLTLVSAGLVSLGLLGQATSFGSEFPLFAIVVLAIVTTVGLLTHLRVFLASNEDLTYVLALNRLRSAALELDPGLAPYLMTSAHDDEAGSRHAYDLVEQRSTGRHVGGSTMMLIVTVNATMSGLLVAAVASALGAALWVLFVAGILAAAAYVVVSGIRGARLYRALWARHVPLSPTP